MNLALNSSSILTEWRARISTSSRPHFGNQIRYFVERVNKDLLFYSILSRVVNKYPYSDEELGKLEILLGERKTLEFVSEEQESAFACQFLTYIVKIYGYQKISELISFQGKDFSDTHSKIVEQLITPQINLINDRMKKDGLVLLLLEKYKFRVECFTGNHLMEQYIQAKSSYEQILEDDIRLYLFDQGINYPFSTPKSSSGRADIVSNIDTNDPLIAEIKIFDRKKGYGLKRIQDGFSQIVKYAGDYNKNVGYLIIFNMDEIELHFDFETQINIGFPSFVFNEKVFYFITINCHKNVSASKIGKFKSIEISREKLVFSI